MSEPQSGQAFAESMRLAWELRTPGDGRRPCGKCNRFDALWIFRPTCGDDYVLCHPCQEYHAQWLTEELARGMLRCPLCGRNDIRTVERRYIRDEGNI